MRRRRPVGVLAEFPAVLDVFTAAEWPESMSLDEAVEAWRDARAEWFAAQDVFPIELCDGRLFEGTGSEWFAAREAWETEHGRALPSWDGATAPDDPFDPRTV